MVWHWWNTGGEVVGYLGGSWLVHNCNFWLSLSHGALLISLSHAKHQSEALMMMGVLCSDKARISGLSMRHFCSKFVKDQISMDGQVLCSLSYSVVSVCNADKQL